MTTPEQTAEQTAEQEQAPAPGGGHCVCDRASSTPGPAHSMTDPSCPLWAEQPAGG